MVNTPPDQRAQLSPPEPAPPRRRHGQFQGLYFLVIISAFFFSAALADRLPADVADRDIYVADASSPATPRALDEPHPAAATAAVALAQLHHHRLASDWDTDMVSDPPWLCQAISLTSIGTLLTPRFSPPGYPLRYRNPPRPDALLY